MTQYLTKQKIFETVASHNITAAEGFKLLKEFQQNSRVIAPIAGTKPSTEVYFRGEWQASETGVIGRQLSRDLSCSLLLFDVNPDVREILKNRLKSRGKAEEGDIILVKPGQNYKELGNHVYEINPADPVHYSRLIISLKKRNRLPDQLLNLWTLDMGTADAQRMLQDSGAAMARSVYSVFHLVKVYAGLKIKLFNRYKFIYKEDNGCPNPFLESVSAYCKSLPMVFPDLSFDTIRLSGLDKDVKGLVDIILRELNLQDGEEGYEILYKQGVRYIKKVKPLEINHSNDTLLKKRGVYLITGGCGALGAIFSRYLAEKYQAVLILMGRSKPGPPKQKILSQLKALGADVLYLQADSADINAVKKVMKKIKEVRILLKVKILMNFKLF
jgi:signal peptidase I